MPTYKPSEKHDSLSSLSYGKYDDMRMPWVGRFPGPRVVAITDASARVADQNENRVWIWLHNAGANDVFLGFGEPAVATESGRVRPGGDVVLTRLTPWPDRIDAICAAGLTSTLLINDVSQITESGRGE